MPALSHAIDAGIAKLEDYVKKSRSLPAHALAMALNPSIRYFWIEKYWSSEEALKAKELVQEHLLQCLEEQEARRQNATQSTMVTVAHTASQAANGNLTRGHEAFLVNEGDLRPVSSYCTEYNPTSSPPTCALIHQLHWNLNSAPTALPPLARLIHPAQQFFDPISTLETLHWLSLSTKHSLSRRLFRQRS
ncbi:hAT family dimerization protein [Rhizoctonia solani]|uniref:HAT family dimerization protein n=1 Tax=Rhizoctonia solani TaxID=456999 RepID=A0A8H8NSB5_9AGAM|nr:hAT family dimerization protein [Rhizoctonia solani]QRW17511.1 hAT family dimerization protein [Rhizoctonia solani]